MSGVENRGRVLVVDDHPNNLLILEELLSDEYQLRAASCGEEALEAVDHFEPDVVLLDVMMPGIDGYETCRRLRETRAGRRAKILMLSARASTADRRAGYEHGADDYLTKPFDHDELRAKLRVYHELRSVQEVDRLKTEFLTILEHEMRTPLTGLLAPLELLRENEGMSAQDRREFVDIATRSARRLQRLLERVMLLGNMRQGRHPWHLRERSLSPLLDELIEEHQEQAEAGGVRIECSGAREARFFCDSEGLRLATRELLANALRASAPGDTVRLRIEESGPGAGLLVSDQGPGIPPSFLPRLFDEFTVPDLDGHQDGSGIGLALVKEVARAHGGRIHVESRPGEGASFRIELRPAADRASAVPWEASR